MPAHPFAIVYVGLRDELVGGIPVGGARPRRRVAGLAGPDRPPVVAPEPPAALRAGRRPGERVVLALVGLGPEPDGPEPDGPELLAGRRAARQSGCEGSVNLDENVSPDA
jgi:hypothetical protein